MNSLMIASQVGLWLVTAFLLLSVFVLARQIGLLHRRIAPAGARMTGVGPPIGELAPAVDGRDLFGQAVTLGVVYQKQTLLVFISPTCPACSKLMPAVRSLCRTERARLLVILVSLGGDERATKNYVEAHNLQRIPVVVSKQVAERYRVASPPYAVMVGQDGLVKAKGVVNHVEHLESLLVAARLGHPTLESYVSAHRQTAAAGRDGYSSGEEQQGIADPARRASL